MKKLLLVYVILWLPTMAMAQMRINTKIGDFYYDFNSSDNTASITYEGTFTEEYHPGGLWPEDNLPTFILSANYSGDVVIPKEVTWNGITYTVTSIDDNAFKYCSGVTSVTIPNSIRSIGNATFSDCSNLTSVHIEDLKAWCEITFKDNPLSIARHLYLNGVEVKDLVLPNDMTSISNGAFAGCSGLTSVIIPNSVTSIGEYAFSGCSGLVYIILPSELNSIGEYAFRGCNNITDVYCEADNIPSTEKQVVSNSENIILHIPSGALENYKSTEYWDKFKEYVPLTNSDIQATEKCSKPTISLVDGKITFNCETPEVTYHWSISSPSGISGSSSNIQPITLNVYTTKSGYQNSDVATYVFPGLYGDVDGNGVVNVADHVKLTEIIMKP